MTESQAYLLIATLWIALSFWAHFKDEETTSIAMALGAMAFFAAAFWVSVT